MTKDKDRERREQDRRDAVNQAAARRLDAIRWQQQQRREKGK